MTLKRVFDHSPALEESRPELCSLSISCAADALTAVASCRRRALCQRMICAVPSRLRLGSWSLGANPQPAQPPGRMLVVASRGKRAENRANFARDSGEAHEK